MCAFLAHVALWLGVKICFEKQKKRKGGEARSGRA